MPDVQLFAVVANGARRLTPPRPLRSIHDLPDDWPYGVYTVFRTFQHDKFLGLADHIERLEQSMALLAWTYELDNRQLRRALQEACHGYPAADARVRVDVLAQPAPGLATDSRVLLTLAPFKPVPAELYARGVRVGLAPKLHRDEPRAKKADFVLARRDYPLGRPEAFDYLLLDDAGHLLEGSSSNFYAVREGTVYTAADGVLEGITRKIVLRLVQALDVPLRLEAVADDEIASLEEAFLSSSSRGILPIVNIAGITVGAGHPGPVTRRLMDAYAGYVAGAIRSAAPDVDGAAR